MNKLANKILEKYKNKIGSPGEEIYLNKADSLDFILQCKKHNIAIWGIDILKITKFSIENPIDKTIVYNDQDNVYTCSVEFIKNQMNDEWNYATIITD